MIFDVDRADNDARLAEGTEVGKKILGPLAPFSGFISKIGSKKLLNSIDYAAF